MPFLRILLLLTLVPSLVTSCATTRSYENWIKTFEGKKEGELTREFGRPNKVQALADGGKMLTFVKSEDPHLVRDPASKKTVVLPDCRTTFLIDGSGNVVGWKYAGPDCRH